jgi:hypothetical protein
MPLFTVLLILGNTQRISRFTNPSKTQPLNPFIPTVLSAIPTYLVASRLYQPAAPSPSDCVRFTRRHDSYRALVIASYGFVFGLPFNFRSLIADFLLSYVVGFAIGERTPKRRRESVVALVWCMASLFMAFLFMVLDLRPRVPQLEYGLEVAGHAIWQAAWLALVDDILGVLMKPDVSTVRGRVVCVLVQGLVIAGLVFFALVLSWRSKQGAAV